jgi:putative membrane protein
LNNFKEIAMSAKNLMGLLVAAAIAGPLAAHAQAPAATMNTPAASPLNAADQQIVKDMAMANMAEVELAKLAQSKSQNADVKAFAQQMIDDHGKALSDVQTLAQNKGVTLPAALDSKHQKEADKLGAKSGDAFDKAYMSKAGVADHKMVHAKLEKDAKRAKDDDVKALANKMLPTVAQHLDHAQKMKPAAKAG